MSGTGRFEVICFANDWGGDRLSKKQIMLRLGRRHRILWINAINNRRPQLAKKDFGRAWAKLRDFRRGLRQVDERIWVLAPIYLPFHGHPALQAINRELLRRQIRRALRRLGFRAPVTYTFVPTSAQVVGRLGESGIVYHCVDEYAAFSDAAPEVARLEQELLRKAQLVLTCSAPLQEEKIKYNSNTRLLTHGVDYEHFRRAAEGSAPPAEELRALPRPILGFHGWVADWVDVPLLGELARLRPDWTLVLVGRADSDLAPIAGLKNVHVLGMRPYEKLPEYLRGFDVALLPFKMNELTRNANPLKLREYLAAGLPVVSAPLPEVLRLREMVAVAATAPEYVQAIEAYLAQGIRGPSQERSKRMAAESWDAKVAVIEELLTATFPAAERARAAEAEC
ncbi:MAG: glycosyltransferase [Terriglobales bacterium]